MSYFFDEVIIEFKKEKKREKLLSLEKNNSTETSFISTCIDKCGIELDKKVILGGKALILLPTELKLININSLKTCSFLGMIPVEVYLDTVFSIKLSFFYYNPQNYNGNSSSHIDSLINKIKSDLPTSKLLEGNNIPMPVKNQVMGYCYLVPENGIETYNAIYILNLGELQYIIRFESGLEMFARWKKVLPVIIDSFETNEQR